MGEFEIKIIWIKLEEIYDDFYQNLILCSYKKNKSMATWNTNPKLRYSSGNFHATSEKLV